MHPLMERIRHASTRPLATLTACIFPLLLSAFVIARCAVRDGNRRLWCDELLSWYPANASFGTMLSSTTDTINAAPPFYFTLAWFWTGIFGDSPLALRLLSAVVASTAIVVIFFVLRRAYGGIAAAAAVLVAFSDSEFLYASCEARFHTLILAEVALAILLYQRILERRRPSMRLLVLNALVHAAMVMTHYLGPLYSGAVLGGLVLSCLYRKRNPLRPAISIFAGWLVFIPWIPVFLLHSGMGKPYFWIPSPTPESLKAYYAGLFGPEFWLLAKFVAGFSAVGFLALLFYKQKPANAAWTRVIRPRETPLLLLAPCLLLVPVAVYFFSIRPGGTSIFSVRYFVPCLLGAAIFYAHLASRTVRLRTVNAPTTATIYHLLNNRFMELRLSMRRSVFPQAMLALQVLTLATLIIWSGINRVWDVSKYAIGREPRPADFPADLTPGEPVVIEHIHEFLKVQFFSKDPNRYVFALDPDVGLAERGGGPLNHQIMAALARQFPERFHRVETTEVLLASAQSFWVKRGGMLWYSMRVEHNPHFTVDKVEDNGNLLHVRRVD